MKYELPKEPPVGSKVITFGGNVYERIHDDTVTNRWYNSGHGVLCSWPELVSIGAEDYKEPDKAGDIWFAPENDWDDAYIRVCVGEDKYRNFRISVDEKGYSRIFSVVESPVGPNEWIKQ